jgi:hypothetical protein
MVAKISSGDNLYGTLSYNQIKVDEDHAKVIFTNNMIESVDGKCDISLCLQTFEPYLLANKRTEKPVLHLSLNPDPKDNLSDEQLSEIAQIYMQKMGYGNQPFIVYKHEDIERAHLHIVSLRVDENGKKIDHNFEHRRSMDVCRMLERQYGLIPADQRQRQEGAPLKPVQPERGDIKHQIANVIRPIAKEYHFLSLKEYRALLSLYNINVEEVRGEINGKLYKGLVYFALNEMGEKVGNPYKSSLFGKSVGIDALEKRIEKSVEIIKDKKLKERCKREITAAMQGTNSRAGFEKALEKKGITVLFRENEQGRIYGATFIDHQQKCVFNGSRLGKEFSANVFNELFTGHTNGAPTRDETPFSPNPQPSQPFQSDKEFGENSNIGGIFDFLTPNNSKSRFWKTNANASVNAVFGTPFNM